MHSRAILSSFLILFMIALLGCRPTVITKDTVISIDDKGGIRDVVHVGDPVDKALKRMGKYLSRYEDSGRCWYYYENGISIITNMSARVVDDIEIDFHDYGGDEIGILDSFITLPVSGDQILQTMGKDASIVDREKKGISESLTYEIGSCHYTFRIRNKKLRRVGIY